jgi:hypothetical protein
MEVSGEFHAPAALPPGERAPDTRWIGDWVDPRTGLADNGEVKIIDSIGTRVPTARTINMKGGGGNLLGPFLRFPPGIYNFL